MGKFVLCRKGIINGVTLILTAGTLASFGLGCSGTNVEEITPTESPTATATFTPIPTPTASPTPSPTSTPMLELSHDEEAALLGVTTKEDPVKIAQCYAIYYEIKQDDGTIKKRIAWMFGSHTNFETGDTSEKLYIHNFWNEKMLFVSNGATAGKSYKEILANGIIPANAALEGAIVKKYCSIFEIKKMYEELGIDCPDSETLKNIISVWNQPGDGYLNFYIPLKDFVDFYLEVTPKEYRTPASEFDEVLTAEETPKVK